MPALPDTPLLSARGINKWFQKPQPFHVLQDIDVDIYAGEFVALIGKSGCGKTRLMYILSTMDTDYTGTLSIKGTDMQNRTQRELSRFRNANIGFVFQFHFLLPEFTALRNVMLPALKLGKYSEEEIAHRAMEKLKLLDLAEQAHKPTNRMSGGQQQRVAIARALINDPALIMGDEPTGNLDTHNTDIVFGILRDLSKSFGQSILAVTHDQDFANRSDRIITMADGQIIDHGR